MKVLYLSCHSILEYDELKLFHELGVDIFSHGAYIDPQNPGDATRPSLDYSVDPILMELAKQNPDKACLSKDLLDKFDVVFFMWKPEWIKSNIENLKNKMCILRTIGQSTKYNEIQIREFKKILGNRLKIVRYSPLERTIPVFAGEDALIRFYKDPEELKDWNGKNNIVITIAQSFKRRSQFCGTEIFLASTDGLPRKVYGKDNQDLGEMAESNITYERLKQVLRDSRVFFYTGTYPASYTLGFIEAFMTGVPIVALGYREGNCSWLPDQCTYEIPFIIRNGENGFWGDYPKILREEIIYLLNNVEKAKEIGEAGRQTAIELFGKEKIKKEWEEFWKDVEEEL